MVFSVAITLLLMHVEAGNESEVQCYRAQASTPHDVSNDSDNSHSYHSLVSWRLLKPMLANEASGSNVYLCHIHASTLRPQLYLRTNLHVTTTIR